MSTPADILTAPTSRLFKVKLPLSKELENKSKLCIKALRQQIMTGSDEQKKETAKNLCSFPFAVLQCICNESEIIKSFCETDPFFIKLLSEKLNKAHHPSTYLHSIDKKEKHSVLELYLAVEFERLALSRDEFKGNHREALDQACELGLNDALVTRCYAAIKILEKKESKPSEKDHAILSIKNDTEKLANLYWGHGYVQAGFILKRTSDLLLAADQKDQSKAFVEEAVKYFTCAYLLKDNEESNHILNNMTDNKGVAAIFERHQLAFPSWEKAQSIFLEWVGKENYLIIEKRAEAELSKALPEKSAGLKMKS